VNEVIEPVSPLLKWVGGKSQLLQEILTRFPKSFGAYHEPFLGGAAIYFGLETQNRASFLSDTNQWLINFYSHVKSSPMELFHEISQLGKVFNSLDAVERSLMFYQLRDEFNSVSEPGLRKAALLLFLNKTCFNGLYRENSKGKFNVPFNQSRGQITFAQLDNLLAASKKLEKASLRNASFTSVQDFVRAGDLVYFDPPYVPLSDTSSFTDYVSDGFGKSQQEELLELASQLRQTGAFVVLSNSYTPWVVENYKKRDFKIYEVKAKRMVAAKTSSRSAVSEAVILGY
jgi:DNA adenine methylase